MASRRGRTGSGVTTGEGAAGALRGWRRVLVVTLATITMVVGLLPAFSSGVLLPFVREDVGISGTFAGLLPTWLFAVAALLSGLAGRFVDRFGPRLGLLALFACATTAWLAASVAGSAAGALAAMTLAGVSMAAATPATTRLLFSVMAGKPLGLALGIAHGGTQLGAMFAGGVLGTIAAALSWRDALRVGALIPLVGFLLAVTPLAATDARERAAAYASSLSFRETLRRTPGLLRLIAFACVLNAGVNAGVVYLPSYAGGTFELGLATAGLTTLVMGASSVAGKVLWGAATEGGGGRRGLQLLAALSATSMALLLVAPSLGVGALWVGTALFGFTATTWAVPATREAALRGGTLRSGSASGAVMIAGFAGGATAPLAFGWVIDVSTYTVGWSVVIALFALAGLIVHGLVQRPAVDTSEDAR